MVSIAERIKSERPHRATLETRTNTALKLYFGREQLETLIDKYSVDEDADKFAWRRRLTIRNFRNFTKEITQKYIASITRAGKVTRVTGTLLDKDTTDSYDTLFWKDIAPYLLLLDELWAAAAFTEAAGDIQTEQDAMDLQGAPKIRVIFPQWIRNFELDDEGNVLWVTIERRTGKDGKKIVVDYYDDKQFGTFTPAGRPIEALKEHNYGRIPVLRFAYAENDSIGCYPPVGHGYMSDVNTAALGLLECVSSLFEAVWVHLRLKLIVNEPTFKQLQEHGIGNTTPIIEKSDPKIDGAGASGQTRYLETPNTEINILRDLVYVQKKDELYEVAHLRNPNKTLVQSGVSKMLDLIPEDEAKADISRYLSTCDKRIVDLRASPIKGYEEKKLEVKYPTIRDGKTVGDATSETSAVSSAIRTGGLPRSKTGDALLSKQLYHKALPETDEKLLKTIDAEIDGSPAAASDPVLDQTTPEEQAKLQAASAST